MAEKNKKKNEAKERMLKYLRELYYKRAYGEGLTNEEEKSIKSISALARYMSEKDEFKMVIYAHDELPEGIASYEERGFLVLSEQSFRKAYKLLEADSRVEEIDGNICYLPLREEKEEIFPILKIADNIEVTPLPHNDFAFYEVRSSISAEVANYINQQFYRHDIRAISLGDVIMCIDICIPNGSRIVKKKPIAERVNECLKSFKLRELNSHGERELDGGYTAQQLEEQRMENDIARYEAEQEFAKRQGGTIKILPKRKVKKKQ